MSRTDCVFGADADTAAAAYAFVLVDGSLVVHNRGCIMGTDLYAGTTAYAGICVDVGLAGAVHFHFSGAGSYPPLEKGLHRKIRQIPNKIPTIAPWLLIHSMVYCEQVG